MKKFLAIVLSLSLLTVLASGLMINAAAFDEKTDYVTFTATGDDPYSVFTFGSSGANQVIDADQVSWCAIRYRTITEKDSEGNPLRGQLYIMPFLEPYVPVEYVFSGEWETAIIDCTDVSDETILASKWNSDYYTTVNQIRFDPLESGRNAEDYGNESAPVVEAGSQIDIAWICFFENEEDARAYTGTESTPYCVLGPGALSKLQTPNLNLTVERHKNTGKFKVANKTGFAGDTVEVNVSLKTNPGIVSLTSRVVFDTDALELVGATDLGLLNGYVDPAQIADPYTFSWSDTGAAENNVETGKFLKLSFRIKDTAAAGVYDITVEGVESLNVAGKQVTFPAATGTIEVLGVMLGDADGDLEITDWDCIVFERYLAGWTVEIVADALDVDKDGEVSDWDAILLSRYLAGWNVEIG